MSTSLVADMGSRDLTTRAVPMHGSEATDDPAKDIRVGLVVAFIFFVIFLGWAAFAPLDAAANATHERESLLVGQATTSPQP